MIKQGIAAIALFAMTGCTTPAPTGDSAAPAPPASALEAATLPPSPEPGVGIFPVPTSQYVCQDGTKLAVRLRGPSAAVSVNGETEIDLPQLSSAEAMTVFSNGRQSLTIRSGKVSWGVGRMVPIPCSGS